MNESKLGAGASLGSYEIADELGRGALGVVYRCRHLHLGRWVALKVMHPVWTSSQEFLQRFREEGRLLALLEHPNILRVYDAGEADGVFYLATQLLEGRTLEAHLGSPIPVDAAVHVARQLASALSYAHNLGVVHRDVKPANVMVGLQGHVTLMDFGVARLCDSPSTTMPGVQVGTPYYMAPELILGRKADPQADVYALAVVLHQMLSGAPPFPGPDTETVFRGHLQQAPPDLGEYCPEWLRQVVRVGLAKAPEDRYPTAAAMLSALSPAPAQLLAAPKQAPPVFEASAPARVGEASSTGPPPEPATSAEARGAGSSGADKPLVRLNRAVLALDVAGSSRMKLAASTLAVQTKFALFRDFVRTQLRACSEAGAAWSGDGLIALFERSGDAANCAVAVLDGLSAFNAGTEGEPIRIRIGVHAGQVLMATGQPIGEVTSAVLDSAGHLQKHAPENSVLISERVFQGVDRPEAWQAAGPEYDLAFNFRVFQYGVARPAAATQEAADLRQLLKEFREQSTVVQSSTEAAPQQAPASRPKAGEPAPKMDRIVLEIDVDGTLTRHEIAGVTLIGRPDPSSSKESKIVVQSDDAISRRHALLSPFRGSFVIEDLNSANGTYLNGRMLSAGEPYPLAPEDRITIGEVTRIRVLPLDPKL